MDVITRLFYWLGGGHKPLSELSAAHTHPYLSDTHPASGVTSAKITNWDAAYGWGNHASAGYLTSVSWSQVSSKPTFATVATSGKYSDLSGLPTIPTTLPANGGNADTVDGYHYNNLPYINRYYGDLNPSTTNGYWCAMTTQSGITGDWWHILHMDWSNAPNWRSELALPTQHRRGVYYRSDNWSWCGWRRLVDYDNGNSNVTISGSFYANSDIRYKAIQNYIDIPLNKIANLSIFDYKWTDDKHDSELHSGMSAQEVEEILPCLVSGDDFKSLNYANFGAISSVIASREIVKLKDRIKYLEEKLEKVGIL